MHESSGKKMSLYQQALFSIKRSDKIWEGEWQRQLYPLNQEIIFLAMSPCSTYAMRLRAARLGMLENADKGFMKLLGVGDDVEGR